MVVSVAVCEIFSVKEWCDLENGVRVCSRSLEMAPFDRSHTCSYSPSIVTIGLGCIVSKLFDVENIVELAFVFANCVTLLKLGHVLFSEVTPKYLRHTEAM